MATVPEAANSFSHAEETALTAVFHFSITARVLQELCKKTILGGKPLIFVTNDNYKGTLDKNLLTSDQQQLIVNTLEMLQKAIPEVLNNKVVVKYHKKRNSDSFEKIGTRADKTAARVLKAIDHILLEEAALELQ